MLVLAGSAVCADKRTNTPVRARAGARVRMFISSATARARARPRGRAPHAAQRARVRAGAHPMPAQTVYILDKYIDANTCPTFAAAALNVHTRSGSVHIRCDCLLPS